MFESISNLQRAKGSFNRSTNRIIKKFERERGTVRLVFEWVFEWGHSNGFGVVGPSLPCTSGFHSNTRTVSSAEVKIAALPLQDSFSAAAAVVHRAKPPHSQREDHALGIESSGTAARR
jgi:hypothetical protein